VYKRQIEEAIADPVRGQDTSLHDPSLGAAMPAAE